MSDVHTRLSQALSGRYELYEEIGAGGMATVYRADDLRHSRPVAVKVIRPEVASALGAERFLREISITANLRHPNIMPLLDSDSVGGMSFYVMPLVDGETLRERLERERRLSVADTVTITRDLAGAIQAAHDVGIVHRDIKPENVLFVDGQAILSDFGIARLISADEVHRLTETGLALGTPAYMSPEQALGEKTVDLRSDVFGLGCVVYEMFAGEPPHTGNTVEAIMARVLHEPPTPLGVVRRDLPSGIQAVVAKALSKVPADRYARIDEFALALEEAAAAPVSVPAAPRRPWRLGIGAVMATGVIAAVVVARSVLMSAPPVTEPVHRPLTALGEIHAATMSPDGQQLAYVTGRAGSVRSLAVRDVTAEQALVVDSLIPYIAHMEWSPDGTRLLLSARRFGSSDQGLYVYPRFGGEPTTITRGFARATWQSDSRILVSDFRTITDVNVAARTADTIPFATGPKIITALAASGESGRIAVMLRPTNASVDRAVDIWTVGRDGTEPLRVASIEEDLHPWIGWTADQRILLVADVAGAQKPTASIYAIPADGASAEPAVVLSGLDLAAGTASSHLTLTDAGDLMYSKAVHTGRVYRLTAAADVTEPDDFTVRILESGNQLRSAPALSPDGKWVAFVSNQGLDYVVVKVSLEDGTRVTVVPPERRPYNAPVWLSDGGRLAFATRGQAGALDRIGLGLVDSDGRRAAVFDRVRLNPAHRPVIRGGDNEILISVGRANRLARLDLETGASRWLFAGHPARGRLAGPTYHQDRNRFAAWFMPFDGSGSRVVTFAPGDSTMTPLYEGEWNVNHVLRWSGDGTRLYEIDGGQSTITITPVDTPADQRVVDIPLEGSVRHCDLHATPVDLTLACVTRETTRDVWIIDGFEDLVRARIRSS